MDQCIHLNTFLNRLCARPHQRLLLGVDCVRGVGVRDRGGEGERKEMSPVLKGRKESEHSGPPLRKRPEAGCSLWPG